MNTVKRLGKAHAWVLVAAGMAVLGCILALVFARFQVFQGIDGPVYLDLAGSLASGKGLVVNNIDIGDRAPYRPLTLWPPAFSALIAGLMWLGVSPPLAALIVGLSSYAVVVVLTMAIALRSYGPAAAVVAGVVLAASPEMWVSATMVWSEPTFTAAALALVLYLSSDQKCTFRSALVAAGLAAMMIYTRNAGYFVVIFLGLMLVCGRDNPERKFIVAVGMLLVLLIAPLWLRNYLMTGTLHGNVVPRPLPETPFENFWMAGLGLADLFLPDRLDQLLDQGAKQIFGALVATAVLAATLAPFLLARLSRARWSAQGRAAALAGLMAFTYTAFLIVIRNFKYFDTMDASRFFWPVLPAIAIILGGCGAELVRDRGKVSKGAFAFALAVYAGLGTYYLWIGTDRAGYPASSSAIAWIRENISSDDCLVSEDKTERTSTLRAYLPDYRVVETPPSFFDDADDIAQRANKVVVGSGCHYFVSLPRYADRGGTRTTMQESAFIHSRPYRDILNDDYDGAAETLLNDDRGVVVYFP